MQQHDELRDDQRLTNQDVREWKHHRVTKKLVEAIKEAYSGRWRKAESQIELGECRGVEIVIDIIEDPLSFLPIKGE